MGSLNKVSEPYLGFNDLNFTNLLPNGTYQNTAEFFRRVLDLMLKFIQESYSRSEKVINFKHPQELGQLFDFDIPEKPKSLDDILEDCENVLKSCLKTGHPRFFNQLSQGLDLVSLAGELITAVTNTNMFTYEIAPVYNLMEESVLRQMRQLFGWQEPGDGIFNPGGSMSNLNALQLAIYSRFPELKKSGHYGTEKKLIVFTSKHSHYSIAKSAIILGLGLDQVRYVPVDSKGKMRVDKLQEMVEQALTDNEIPLFVTATEGTTVLGAFDPIPEIADVCQQYNMWLHIDASWGGAALLSSKYKHLLNGIERGDSVAWNPHKMMGTIQNDSAFLVKRPGLMLECNKMNASYLFQSDKNYDIRYDTGDKAMQCGRHVDVFKVWLMWSAKGSRGFEEQINKEFELAHYLYEQLSKRDNFELAQTDPEFTNICFWYVPNSLKAMEKSSVEYKQKLNMIAPKIKERMMVEGKLMIGYQPLDDKPNFFRMVVSNHATQLEDIEFMLSEMERLGSDL